MSDRLRRLSPSEIADALDERASDPTVLGIVLAAGQSTRFGEANKLLARVEGDPLVRHAVRTLRESCVSAVAVVTGHEAEAVRDALDGCDVRFVPNRDYERGMSTSVSTGVDLAIEMDADAVVFLPGDMPLVNPRSVDHLVDAYRSDQTSAVAAAHDGQRGNPVLFDRQHFETLRSVAGDVGGRGVLLESDDGALVDIDDSGVLADIDTEADLDSRRLSESSR